VPQIDKDLMLSFDEVSVVVLFSQTNCHLLNYAAQWSKDLMRFSQTNHMCSITYRHHHQWPPKSITDGNADINWNFLIVYHTHYKAKCRFEHLKLKLNNIYHLFRSDNLSFVIHLLLLCNYGD